MFGVTSLLTSQAKNALWLKDERPTAVARPRVAAGLASDTNCRRLDVAVMPSSSLWRSTLKSLISLMAISLSLVSPVQGSGNVSDDFPFLDQ